MKLLFMGLQKNETHKKIYKPINVFNYMKKTDIALIISSISFILFVISLTLLLGDKFHVRGCGCPNVIERNFVFLFIFLSSLFIGFLIYYLSLIKIEAKNISIEKNIALVLNFLDKKEKAFLKELIKNKGEITQTELTKKFGKLTSHRLIQRLLNKKIVDVENIGKTNKIKLKQELKKFLVK